MWRLFRLWQWTRTDLRVLWFAMRHPNRPVWLMPAAAGLLLYALDPLNLALPVVGVVDEFLILPLALHGLIRLLPRHVRADVARSRRITSPRDP